MSKGRAAPSWYYEEPAAEPGDEFYMAAFWDLTTERPHLGMSAVPGPIPWRAIVDYAQHHGLEPDVSAAFEQVIREMDTAYLVWRDRKSKTKEK